MIRSRYPFSLLIALCSLPVRAAAPARLSAWVQKLNDVDPALRAEARENLMTISRPDLDTLSQLIARAAPLAPEQIVSLHDIVTQVILASVARDNASNKGFLGARLEECQLPAAGRTPRPAILVCQCIPGFDAYRMLRIDDVILALDGDARRAHDVQTFTADIQSLPPGQKIALKILRGGQITTVLLELSARPLSADNLNLAELLQTQNQSVEQYWQSTFSPALQRSAHHPP